MNQLQAVALNEGVRRRKGLWSKSGRLQLESLRLAPWATRRRQDLLGLLDYLELRIADLSAAVEQGAQRRPVALQLMTHPGGATDRSSFPDGDWNSAALCVRQTDQQLSGIDSQRGL
jgi:hypothetical protein